ncbi:hypothetical protein BD560DRAFT_429466 [Blakeslea trispora]|nr:hypothetical protein BD560DRAFT_429466 [Blakeslea trispora]
MSDTRPASVPDLSAHGQQIMKQFFQYHHLILLHFQCFNALFVRISQPLPLLKRRFNKQSSFQHEVPQHQSATPLPKQPNSRKSARELLAMPAMALKRVPQLRHLSKLVNPKTATTTTTNSDGDIHSTINDKEIALLREMLLSLQDKLSDLEKENKTIKNQMQMYISKNAELEHQLLSQQKQQAMITLQQQQQQQQDQDMLYLVSLNPNTLISLMLISAFKSDQ